MWFHLLFFMSMSVLAWSLGSEAESPELPHTKNRIENDRLDDEKPPTYWDTMYKLFESIAKKIIHLDCTAPRNSGDFCEENSSTRMFYFDPRTGVCQPFVYNGCGGNSNRFLTAMDCKNNCSAIRKSPEARRNGNQWTLAEKCDANFLIPNGKYFTCSDGCPENHECKNGVCCPIKEYVCSLPDDSGMFAEGIDDKPRFAWSDAIQSCWRFSYFGANGNYNNFPTFQSCVAYCSSKQ